MSVLLSRSPSPSLSAGADANGTKGRQRGNVAVQTVLAPDKKRQLGALRGLYVGRHIQFRNQNSEDGGKVHIVEELWKDFFLDPSQWLDNRATKRSRNSPDFVHFSTKEALWIDGRLNPSWIQARLKELAEALPARGQRVVLRNNYTSVEIEKKKSARLTREESGLEHLKDLCERGQLNEAIQAVERLKLQGWRIANIITSLLNVCISNKDLRVAKAVDKLTVSSGLGPHSFVGSLLIRAFGVCGCLVHAWGVFKRIPRPSLLTWNALLSAHVKCEQHEKVLELYVSMCQQAVMVNEHTFVAVLKASTKLADLFKGQIIHFHVIYTGLEADVNIGSCLMQMYAECTTLYDAQRVFETLPKESSLPWTAMIDVYVQHECTEEALELFRTLYDHRVEPDIALFVSILKGCSSAADLDQGRHIHTEVISSGLQADMYVATTLIDLYIKCEQLEDARNVYNKLPKKDVVTWSLMIAGCVQLGYPQETLQLLEQMQRVGVQPNHVTFVSILQACSDVGSMDIGHVIHTDMIENGLQIDSYVISGLIDMYAKCGSIEDAHSVFDKSLNRNVVIWSALMTTYLMHKDYATALQCFMAMQQEGLKPDEVALTNAISLCNQEGLMHEGCRHFEDFGHGCSLKLEHYACMIGLLARAGCLVEAEAILQSMPFLANMEGWLSLLGSCKMYGDNQLGRKCFQTIMLMDPVLAPGFLLTSDAMNFNFVGGENML